MKIVDCVQGTPEWYSARLGIPTASCFDKIVDDEGNPSKTRKRYMFQLAGERVTGKMEETFQSQAMLRGKEMEAEARSFYEVVSGNEVIPVGFCVSEGGAVYGASPDGLVGKEGTIEIKCPTMATHVSYLLDGNLPSDYFQQVQGQLLVTGREWCDFVSYYPGMNPLIIRIVPNAKFQKKLKQELETFCKELEQVVKKIS